MPNDPSAPEVKISLWMPLDIGPFLQDTAHLSTEEIGAYALLLLYYWAHGSLPNDPRRLANIAKMSLDTWSITYESLSMFFFEGLDGLLHQKGADRRRAQWIDKRLKAREKALKAINARWSKHRAKLASGSNTPSIPEEIRREILEHYPTSVIQVQEQKPSPPTAPRGPLDQNPVLQAASELPEAPAAIAGQAPPAANAESENKGNPADFGSTGRPNGRLGGNVQEVTGDRMAPHSTSGARHSKSSSGPEKSGSAPNDPESVRKAKFLGSAKIEVFRFWAAAGGSEEFECPWSDLEDRALGRLYKENPKIDEAHFKQLLVNRAASESVNRAEPPRKWLRSLVKYAHGPLDRFGKPLKAPRTL